MISYPILLPAGTSPRIITIKGVNEASITESPFTAEQQVQSFPVDRWQAEIEYPPMDRAAAEVMMSRLLSLYGAGGVLYLGDSSAAAPRGVATGSPIIAGASQTGKMLLTRGWTFGITGILKEGDWLQFGHGLNATRIQTSGGSTTSKYSTDLGVSVNGQRYLTRMRISNPGAKAVTLVDSMGGSQTVAAGAMDTQVILNSVGNGVAHIQPIFQSPASGDSLDFVAWDPVVQRYGVDENLIALANRTFISWGAGGGATITLTQNLNQRLHKLVNADANSDAAGFAPLDLWPRQRESPIDTYPITVVSPKGLFRLASDSVDWTIDEALKYGVKFSAMEAY